MAKIPHYLSTIFWDTNVKNLNLKAHSNYIIERILELGDIKAVSWMFRAFPKQKVKSVLEKSKRLSQKSRNFWKLVLK